MKTLTLLIACLISGSACAQFKIGNLTVSDSIFKEYIYDLHANPVTVERRDYWNYCEHGHVMHIGGGASISHGGHDVCIKENKQFNYDLAKRGTEIMVWNKERYDSIWEWPNGWSWSSTSFNGVTNWKQLKKDRGKLLRIVHTPARKYKEPTGQYRVPRDPSERDFVVWFNKRRKKS
jgi:hypothetical protein